MTPTSRRERVPSRVRVSTAGAQPEVYVDFTSDMIDDAGNVATAHTPEFLRNRRQESHIVVVKVVGAYRITP